MRLDTPDRPITSKERVWFAGVLALLTAACVALAPGCKAVKTKPEAWIVPTGDGSAASDESAAYVMRRGLKIMQQMAADYGMEPVRIDWGPCGEENGYYYEPEGDSPAWLHICAEDLAHPGWMVQVVAHEYGHAVTDRLASITDENAADELAILAMARHGWWDEMLDAAVYMQEHWPANHWPGDPHPGGAYRAWELVCAEAGVEGLADPSRPASPDCDALYRGLVVKWDRRIPRVDTPLNISLPFIGLPRLPH